MRRSFALSKENDVLEEFCVSGVSRLRGSSKGWMWQCFGFFLVAPGGEIGLFSKLLPSG